MTLGEKINAANAEALKIILGAQPTLIGVGTAGEDIPGMTKKTILHSRNLGEHVRPHQGCCYRRSDL